MSLLWRDCKTSPVATERKLPLLSVFRSKEGGEVVDLAPDLIVVDDLWRDGQTSWLLRQWLTLDQRTRHLPVILLTGAVEQFRERDLRRMGVTIVPKPCDLAGLLHTIGTLLASATWTGHGA